MKIYKVIPIIMGELGAIARERRGDSIRYQYRGIDDIYNALAPLCAKHGVFSVPIVNKHERFERQSKNGGTLFHVIADITYRFYCDDGSFVDAVVVGEAMDSGDKAFNKALSIAHKYALTQVFKIRTEDLDPDGEVHEVHEAVEKFDHRKQQAHKLLTEAQLRKIQALANEAGLAGDDFREVVAKAVGKPVSNLNEIPFDRVDAVISAIKSIHTPMGLEPK